MDLEKSILATQIYTKEPMETVNQMATVSTFGIVEVYIKDILRMDWGMEKVLPIW